MNQPTQGQAPQGQPMRLLRPEMMRGINYLSQEEKVRYEEGLRQLWSKIDGNGPETSDHQVAKQKVVEFTRMVMNKVRSVQAASQARNQAAQLGQPVQSTQSAQPNQQQGGQGGQGEQSQNALAAAQKSAAQTIRTQGPNTTNNNISAGTSAAGAAPQNQNTQASQPMPKHIQDHVEKMPWHYLKPPAQYTPEQGAKWLAGTKARYGQLLVSMESIKTRTAKWDAAVKERAEKGQPLSAEEMKKYQAQRAGDTKMYADAQKYVNGVQAQIKNAQAQPNSAGQNAQQGRAQPMQNQNVTSAASSNPMQAATASVNAAMDAAKSQQLGARATPAGQAQPQPQQQPQSQPQHPGTPATPVTPAANIQQQHQQQHQPQQIQAPAAHAIPTPIPQPQIKSEPTNSMAHPPPVNTALAAASAHLSSAGTPTQARVQTPQSASQQAPTSQVRPLTHAAAVNRANSSTNITGQPNNSSGNLTTTPGSTGLLSNGPHAAHSHAHPQPNTPASLNSRMPINKNLPAKSTETPVPVAPVGGVTAGRPSYGGGSSTGGGVMGQPVIAKMPVPQFDAEGEHVLSKKKLDELVRQVCGGGSPGADGNYLTPDVEEVRLSSLFPLIFFLPI